MIELISISSKCQKNLLLRMLTKRNAHKIFRTLINFLETRENKKILRGFLLIRTCQLQNSLEKIVLLASTASNKDPQSQLHKPKVKRSIRIKIIITDFVKQTKRKLNSRKHIQD